MIAEKTAFLGDLCVSSAAGGKTAFSNSTPLGKLSQRISECLIHPPGTLRERIEYRK
jgi:hypothetical protein